MRKRLTTEEFIKRCNEIHGNKYTYNLIGYKNTNSTILVTCPVHGEFEQTAAVHMRGHGCKKCQYEKLSKKYKHNTKIFIEKARKIHGDKYDYSKVSYRSYHEKVIISCKKHGDFLQTPADHLSGHGCPKCANELTGQNSRKTFQEFLEKATRVHGDFYDYSSVNFKDNNTNIKIICPLHGPFMQTPYSHSNGHGCPKCASNAGRSEEAIKKGLNTKRRNGTFNTSKPQNALYKNLIETFGKEDVKSEYSKDNRYPFACDFYIKSKDLFIELNAHWTHGRHFFDKNDENDQKLLDNMKNKSENSDYYKNAVKVWTERDVLKRDTAKQNNINYVVLWNEKDVKEWFSAGCPIRKDWV